MSNASSLSPFGLSGGGDSLQEIVQKTNAKRKIEKKKDLEFMKLYCLKMIFAKIRFIEEDLLIEFIFAVDLHQVLFE
jgi:hypothetical protein